MDNRSELIAVRLSPKERDLLNQYCGLMKIENKSEWIRNLIRKELINND